MVSGIFFLTGGLFSRHLGFGKLGTRLPGNLPGNLGGSFNFEGFGNLGSRLPGNLEGSFNFDGVGNFGSRNLGRGSFLIALYQIGGNSEVLFEISWAFVSFWSAMRDGRRAMT